MTHTIISVTQTFSYFIVSLRYDQISSEPSNSLQIISEKSNNNMAVASRHNDTSQFFAKLRFYRNNNFRLVPFHLVSPKIPKTVTLAQKNDVPNDTSHLFEKLCSA